MKRSLITLVTVCLLIVSQGCETKSKEKAEAEAAEAQEVEQASAATKKRETIVAKRVMIEKARAEKVELRKKADAEKVKIALFYKNASGMVIYHKAETEPSYAGGNSAMTDYLRDNLKYPTEASENGIEGTVYVDFVVGDNGVVKDVVATDFAGDDVDQSLKDEAVRVVSSMPAWVPGRQQGKPVNTSFSIPITFQLD